MTEPTDAELGKLAEECGIGWGAGLGGMSDFLSAFEAEVRKQDDALIRQMLEVLEYVRNTPEAEYDSKAALSKAQAAITAARARLGEKT